MKHNPTLIRQKITQTGLKATPQRIAVYNTLLERKDHPTADMIYNELVDQFPGLSHATVYNVLDTLCEKGLISRVKTGKGTMRYDAIESPHHHLYCSQSDRMEDYVDEELDVLLRNYFLQKNITGFDIRDIKLQLTGEFKIV